MSAFSYSGFASVAPVQVSLKASCCAPKAESAANAVQYLVLWLFTFSGDANLSPSRCRCSLSTPMRESGHAQWFFIWTCLHRSLLSALFLYLCSSAVTSMAKLSCAPPDAWCLAASCCSLSLEMVCVQWPLQSYTQPMSMLDAASSFSPIHSTSSLTCTSGFPVGHISMCGLISCMSTCSLSLTSSPALHSNCLPTVTP